MTTTYRLHAPELTGQSDNTAQAFGGAVWLWMHPPILQGLSLAGLRAHLFAPMQQGLYVMASRQAESGRQEPAALLVYARFNAESEHRHMVNPASAIPAEDWLSGDRLWLISWVAPFGDTPKLRTAMCQLFGNETARSLDHHGAHRGQRVVYWHGHRRDRESARQWWQGRPIQAVPMPL